MGKVSENTESENLANWLRINNYMFTHIANESGLPPKVAMLSALRKKRMGLSPGFPDFCIILKRGSLLFIELKKQRTKKKNGEFKALSTDGISISEEQKQWCDKLNEIPNVQADICYGAEESIKNILKIENL